MTYFIQLINANVISIHTYNCPKILEEKVISRQDDYAKATAYVKMKQETVPINYVPCSCCSSEKER